MREITKNNRNAPWSIAAVWVLRLLAIILALGTLSSETGFNNWWIRIWDFPRVQIVLAMVLIAAALLYFDRRRGRWLVVALAALTTWQLYRIYPYTPLAATEVARRPDDGVSQNTCFTMLTLNVLQTNRDYGRTIALIESINPDIVLLTETDQQWAQAVKPVLSAYPHQMQRPLANTYGMLFATRLPMRDASIQDLAEKDTPSLFATLSMSGQDFRVVGLHPRPPHPDQDTDERDAEIVMAARHARKVGLPVLALGDFNDVAWSDTTDLFRNVGSFLDPRIGRGTYATFPADYVWLGWPLDHLFVTEEFLLGEMRVGRPVGSDHLPVLAQMCLAPAAAARRNDDAPVADADDRQEAREIIGEYRQDSREDVLKNR